MFRKLWLVFKYGPELEALPDEKRQKRELAEWEATRHNLRLCYKHRQERNHSQYNEQNCDYCKLLKKVEREHENI